MLLLVRHGLTPSTGRDLPEPGAGPGLTDDGKDRPRRRRSTSPSGARLCQPLAAIYCSPLTRTRETAAVLGKALDIAPVEHRDLVDCDTGEWAGAALKDLVKKPEWTTVVSYPSGFRFPGGESMREMSDRIVGAVKTLVSRHPGQSLDSRVPRRPDQGRRNRRSGPPPRPVPAGLRLPRLRQRHLLRRPGSAA